MPGPASHPDERASALLDRCRSEPVEVVREGRALVVQLDDRDSLAIAYRAMSIAARNGSTIEESIDFARKAVDVATDDTLRREAMGTLSGSLAISGDTGAAIEVLHDATGGAKGLIAGQLEFQMGFVHTQVGDYEAALDAYRRALPTLRRHGSDLEPLLLNNEGYIYLQLGRLDEAEHRLREVRDIEEAAGRHMEVSGIDHNLGLLASYRGDIPEALRRFAMSDEAKAIHAGDEVPHHVTRCEVLLTAGLAREALELARRIAVAAGEQGRADDEADALLVAARAAFEAGDPGQAAGLAAVAARRFESQGRLAWMAQARVVATEAALDAEGESEALLAEASDLAASLDHSGLSFAATRAHLLAGRIALALDDSERASVEFQHLIHESGGPVELRIQRYLARALLHESSGDLRGADAAARAGLGLLDEYQAGLGASDMRSGIERHGAALGDIGLRLAAGSRDTRRLFRWMERTRARALRHPPIVPERDESSRELLEQLRRVGSDLRTTPDDPELLRRRQKLQETLRDSARAQRGRSGVTGHLDLGSLMDMLGDRTLVELGVIGDELMAIEVRRGRFSRRSIGNIDEIRRELSRLRFDMRRAARLRRDPSRVIEATARFGTMVLDDRGDGEELVLIPPATLMSAPWAVIPALAGRTVTLSPSAEIWARSVGSKPESEGVVLAAGPDLENSVAEVARLADLYEGAAVVLGPSDETAHFADHVAGSSIAHAACHATFEMENPMFSSLRLGDGDFNVYDLERLQRPPHLMVLSACDSGFTETNAGDELTGVTSALLSMGSGSVVASIGLVPDSEATAELMYRFHRRLAGGATPSAALAQSQAELTDDPAGYIAAASFVCVGGG